MTRTRQRENRDGARAENRDSNRKEIETRIGSWRVKGKRRDENGRERGKGWRSGDDYGSSGGDATICHSTRATVRLEYSGILLY